MKTLLALAFLCAWLVFGGAALAHPVAQGSLELEEKDGALELRVRVSNEQVFVATALGKNARAAAGLSEFWPVHGDYLLAHLRLETGGVLLQGTVDAITVPEDKTTSGFTLYRLRYPLPAGPAGELRLGQDLLNEIEFAPGNPWEATLAVRQVQGGRVLRDGLLLTRFEPLLIDCRADAQKNSDTPWRTAAAAYFKHGVHHILAGWDHLLFMAVLVLATRSLWDLLRVVTVFTAAHTLTLTLSVLDVIRLPGRIVEPMIALSIVFIALENILRPERTRGAARLLAVFGFGLFHGLGFAGGLLDAMQDLAGATIGVALGAFSLGVEAGHQLVALPLFAALWALHGRAPQAPARRWLNAAALRGGSALIGLAGIVYLVAALRL